MRRVFVVLLAIMLALWGATTPMAQGAVPTPTPVPKPATTTAVAPKVIGVLSTHPQFPSAKIGDTLTVRQFNTMRQTETSAQAKSLSVQSLPDLSRSTTGSVVAPAGIAPVNPSRVDIIPYVGCGWGGTWVRIARMKYCSGQLGWNFDTYLLTSSGYTKTGTSDGVLLYEILLNAGQTTYPMRFHVRSYEVHGSLASGVYVRPVLICSLYCTSGGFSPQGMSMGNHTEAEVRTTISSYVPAVGTQVGENFHIKLTVQGAATSDSSDYQTSATIRCQNGMVVTNRAGCNMHGVPGLVQYSRAAGSPDQAVAIHIAQAWGRFSINIGDLFTGPSLSRTMDANRMRLNRNVAASACRKIGAVEGADCDEYPFASTYQGGYSTGGDPNRFSVKRVNATQNRTAGVELVNAYNSQAISNTETFYMWVH